MAQDFREPPSQEKSLSAGLAKLDHLRELVLDLHYKDDIKPWLGRHGVLNLVGLNKLVTLRLPLYFLVEIHSGSSTSITDLGLALPPVVQRLTVSADGDTVRRPSIMIVSPHASQVITKYHPSQMALQFLHSLSTRVANHFTDLEEVTYCYRDQALGTACRCHENVPCTHCEASRLLDPYTAYGSSAQMQILSSRFQQNDVRLHVLQEQAEG